MAAQSIAGGKTRHCMALLVFRGKWTESLEHMLEAALAAAGSQQRTGVAEARRSLPLRPNKPKRHALLQRR